MVRQLTTRAQVSGYRFLLQRAEHALVRRDARMLHDPMRAQRRSRSARHSDPRCRGVRVYGLIRRSDRSPMRRSICRSGRRALTSSSRAPAPRAQPRLGTPDRRVGGRKPKTVAAGRCAVTAVGRRREIVGAPNAGSGASRPDGVRRGQRRWRCPSRRTVVVIGEVRVGRSGRRCRRRVVRRRRRTGPTVSNRAGERGADGACPIRRRRRARAPSAGACTARWRDGCRQGLANAIEEVAPLAVPEDRAVPAGPVRWGCPSALSSGRPRTGCRTLVAL